MAKKPTAQIHSLDEEVEKELRNIAVELLFQMGELLEV